MSENPRNNVDGFNLFTARYIDAQTVKIVFLKDRCDAPH